MWMDRISILWNQGYGNLRKPTFYLLNYHETYEKLYLNYQEIHEILGIEIFNLQLCTHKTTLSNQIKF